MVTFLPQRCRARRFGWRGMNSERVASVTPADREDDADVVLGGVGVGGTAIERVEHAEREKQVLPELTLCADVQLEAVPAETTEARIVLRRKVEIRLRPVIRVKRGMEEEQRIEVLRACYVDALLFVDHEPGTE